MALGKRKQTESWQYALRSWTAVHTTALQAPLCYLHIPKEILGAQGWDHQRAEEDADHGSFYSRTVLTFWGQVRGNPAEEW